MQVGVVACSFCTGVESASWVPDLGVVIVASIAAGVVVLIGAAFSWGRRASALGAVAVALLIVLPAAGILAGADTQIDGVATAAQADAPDGLWRVRCEGAFPSRPEDPQGGFVGLQEACADATATRRAATVALAALGGLTVGGGLVVAIPRPRKHPSATAPLSIPV